MSDSLRKKISNGSVNIFGKRFKNNILKDYNGCEVVLIKDITECGFDVYYKTHFICYIKTINQPLKEK